MEHDSRSCADTICSGRITIRGLWLGSLLSSTVDDNGNSAAHGVADDDWVHDDSVSSDLDSCLLVFVLKALLF